MEENIDMCTVRVIDSRYTYLPSIKVYFIPMNYALKGTCPIYSFTFSKKKNIHPENLIIFSFLKC